MTTPSDASQAVELPPSGLPTYIANYKLAVAGGRDDVNFWRDAIVRAAIAQDRAARAQAEPEGWRDALRYYADRNHFLLADEDAWDTVSGEPANFWCDEAGTATVEDGTVAAMALAGTPLRDEDEDAARAQGAGEAVAQVTPSLKRHALEWAKALSEYAAAPFFPDTEQRGRVRSTSSDWWDGLADLIEETQPLIARALRECAAPTIPQAAEVPGFVPLTDEQIEPLYRAALKMETVGEKDSWFWFAWGVQLGERTHGIIPAAAPTPTAGE